jgi:xanthosine utilization system XapX-like protein
MLATVVGVIFAVAAAPVPAPPEKLIAGALV